MAWHLVWTFYRTIKKFTLKGTNKKELIFSLQLASSLFESSRKYFKVFFFMTYFYPPVSAIKRQFTYVYFIARRSPTLRNLNYLLRSLCDYYSRLTKENHNIAARSFDRDHRVHKSQRNRVRFCLISRIQTLLLKVSNIFFLKDITHLLRIGRSQQL